MSYPGYPPPGGGYPPAAPGKRLRAGGEGNALSVLRPGVKSEGGMGLSSHFLTTPRSQPGGEGLEKILDPGPTDLKHFRKAGTRPGPSFLL